MNYYSILLNIVKCYFLLAVKNKIEPAEIAELSFPVLFYFAADVLFIRFFVLQFFITYI